MNILEEEKNRYITIEKKLHSYREELETQFNISLHLEDKVKSEIFSDMYRRMINQFESNKLKPYFAKIVFNPSSEKEKTIAYIGRIGFANLNDEDIIIDWRAPISELYYNSKLGETFFYIDNEKISGILELKRQINFKNNEIVSVFDIDDNILNDELLLPYLNQTNDSRLKNIVSTIQSEQNNIIRKKILDNIIVQGVAGSGKTTVALHRLSYLVYNYRKIIKPENFLIISPNLIFKNYISSLLEDLDADKTQSHSIEEIVKKVIDSGCTILEKGKQFELLKNNKIKPNYLQIKNSIHFKNLLDKYIESLEKKWFKKDFYIENVLVCSANRFFEIYENERKSTIEQSIVNCAKKIEFLLKNDTKINDEIDKYSDENNISFQNKLKTKRIIFEDGCSKYVKKLFGGKKSIISLYKDFIKNLDFFAENNYDENEIKILKKETLKNLNKKIISFDDVGGLIYIYTKLYQNKEFFDIKQVLVDEAQDFSYLIYNSLVNLFPNATFSIFGDIAQGIYDYQSINDWKDIKSLFTNCQLINLAKSYRSTIEITENANKILKKLNYHEAENVIRHGESVDYYSKEKFIKIKDELIKKLINKYTNLAIIFKDNDELNSQKEKYSKFNYKIISETDDSYENNNLFLLTVETAKGLEFESVIVYNSNAYTQSDNILELKKLYVAETRSLHKLIIIN